MYPSLKIQWDRIWPVLALLSAMLLLSACTSGDASQPGQSAVAQVTSSQGTATALLPSPTDNLPTPESTRDYYATPTPWPGTPPPVITAHTVGQEPTLPPVVTIPPKPTLVPTTNTILLQDDFSNDTSANYRIVGLLGADTHNWYVKDHMFRQDVYDPEYNGSIAVTGNVTWTNYTVESDMLTYGYGVGIVANYSAVGFYLLRFGCCPDPDGTLHMWELERSSNPDVPPDYVTIVKGPINDAFKVGEWNHVSLSFNNGIVTIKVNGLVEGTATDSTYSSGQAGLFAEQSDSKFASLRISILPLLSPS